MFIQCLDTATLPGCQTIYLNTFKFVDVPFMESSTGDEGAEGAGPGASETSSKLCLSAKKRQFWGLGANYVTAHLNSLYNEELGS